MKSWCSSLERFHGQWTLRAGREAGKKRGFFPGPQPLRREVRLGAALERPHASGVGAAGPAGHTAPGLSWGEVGLGRLWLGCEQWATWGPSRQGVHRWLAGWSCPGCGGRGPPSRSLTSVRSSGPPAHKPLNRPVSSPDLLWGHFTQVPFHQWLWTDDQPGAGAPGALSSPALLPASPAWACEAALAVTVPGMLFWAQPHTRPPGRAAAPTPALSVSQLIAPPAANVAAQCPQPWGPCQPLDFTEQLWPHLLL